MLSLSACLVRRDGEIITEAIKTRRYSWGIKELDEVTGGIQSTLNMLYGETGSGKTTLAAYVPISRIVTELKNTIGEIPEKGRFFVIDGDGGFDFERATQIWESQGLNSDEIKTHLFHKEITGFDEQHKFVTKELANLIEENEWKPLLFTFDPMTAVYRGIILRTDMRFRGVAIGSYTGRLDLQLGTLRHLAVTYDCPCIVTTWPGSPIRIGKEAVEGEFPFIGGRQFGFLPKLIVEISIPKHGLSFRKAYLYKARGLPVGKSCHFKLSDVGIETCTEQEIVEIG